jgi:hypothetical protein
MEVTGMNNGTAELHVGAPDPELKTSPILEEYDEEAPLMAQEFDELPVCWFNGEAYDSGTMLHSGDGSLLCCEKGVWIRMDDPKP